MTLISKTLCKTSLLWTTSHHHLYLLSCLYMMGQWVYLPTIALVWGEGEVYCINYLILCIRSAICLIIFLCQEHHRHIVMILKRGKTISRSSVFSRVHREEPSVEGCVDLSIISRHPTGHGPCMTIGCMSLLWRSAGERNFNDDATHRRLMWYAPHATHV